MAKKHNGNLDIYGVLTVGADISAAQYSLPRYKGDEGDIIQIVGGEAVFSDKLTQLEQSIIGVSGSVDNFVELFDTPKPSSIINSHQGEIIIVSPTASVDIEKISYSGVTIDDIFAYADQTTIDSYVTNVNSISGDISILPGSGIEVSTAPNGQITISLYQAISISSFTGGSTNEIGSTVSSVSLNWTYNKTETSQSLNQGIGTVTNGVRTYTYSTPITSNTTFTLSASDGTTTTSSNTSVSFLPRVWWGTDSKTSLTSADILLLDNNQLSSTRARSLTINGNGEYIYYAYPASYGTATFTVNGLLNTAWTLTTVMHSNLLTPGNTQLYNVYRSNTIQNGTGISIVIS